MIHAYAETYLNDAMSNLGEAFDYAVNACGLSPDKFMELFIASGFADKFGKGNPKVISGTSGTELVMEVLGSSGLTVQFPEAQIDYDCSAEYWCGWILAYYQWFTAMSFKDIHAGITMKEVLKLYPVMHEAAEEKFVDTVNTILHTNETATSAQTMWIFSKRTCREIRGKLTHFTAI